MTATWGCPQCGTTLDDSGQLCEHQRVTPQPTENDTNPSKLKRVGAYAKLLANYASDDAIIEAGEAAELLFCRGLAFCSTSDSDGYITDAQVTRYVGAGMRDAMKRAHKLAEVGVWERVGGGFQVRSWLKIHDSSEVKGRRRKADRERKAKPADSEPSSDGNPSGIQTEGVAESLSLIHDSAVQEHNSATTEHDELHLGGDRNETLRVVPEPEPICTTHPDGDTGEACGGCARRNAWIKKQTARLLGEIDAIIAACPDCDEHGRRLDPDSLTPVGDCPRHKSRRSA